MKSPLVSIIIPVFNAEKHLAETISSAINQTYNPKEIIIIDDGSTDNSPQIAQDFISENIHVFKQQNAGASAARNVGIKHSTGDYIQFLDADDLLDPNKIFLQIKLIKDHNDILAFGDTIFLIGAENTSNLKPAHYNDFKKHLIISPLNLLLTLFTGFGGRGEMIAIHSWLTPRSVIEKAGAWNEELSMDDDGEFFCRVVLESEGIIYTPEAINFYRKYRNGENLSGQKNLKALYSRILATDLKYKHIGKHCSKDLLDSAFGRFYWEIGFESFPKFKEISNTCLKRAKELNYSANYYQGGKKSTLLNKLFGWRIARIASFLKHGL